ncbi:MAG: radical SAM protein [Thermoplasmata archaeon]|jgi:radical SAM protein with 4Fe4S-binding SPASM domain|nr:radical SAM protein [Thermoplasmata archaeon]
MGARAVKPFYNPPSLLTKQVRSALLIRKLTGWTKLPWWTTQAGKIFQIAAGCQGVGCFGYPAHPVWEVTARCNLKCDHCHARAGENEQLDELTTEEGKTKVIDSLARVQDFRTLVFSGGEPLVREDLFDLIAHAKMRGFYPLIATNATLITPDVAKKLKRAGLLGIAASIDSTRDEVHDSFRGMQGALKLAKEGIANASAEGMYIQINITASKLNKEELPSIVRFADELRAHVILLYQFIPCGRGTESAQLEFNAEEFREEILQAGAMQKDLHPVIAPVGLPEYWALHNVMKNDGRHSDVLRGCICGNGMFYIKPNGDVWPCAFVPISGGNLRTTSAAEIWERSELFLKLRDRKNLEGICGECGQRETCGGCRARALAHTGNVFAGDPICALTADERSRARKP